MSSMQMEIFFMLAILVIWPYGNYLLDDKSNILIQMKGGGGMVSYTIFKNLCVGHINIFVILAIFAI